MRLLLSLVLLRLEQLLELYQVNIFERKQETDFYLKLIFTVAIIAATPALAACNSAFGICEAACVVAILTPTP